MPFVESTATAGNTFTFVLSSGPAKTRTGVQCSPPSVLRETAMSLKSCAFAFKMPTCPDTKTAYTLWLVGSATIGPAMLLNVAFSGHRPGSGDCIANSGPGETVIIGALHTD